ncbi:hypothetical protein DFQ26_002872 [Actinomortierella ambigua]|nr:hypothetical protein DFQ26_002872 [Actinomortierella ambigua]
MSFLASLATYVPSLLNSDKHSDAKLIIGKEKVVRHGHSIILCARSPYFEKSRVVKGSKIIFRLPDVDPDVFDAVLQHIYTGQVMITIDIVARLYIAATWMCLEELANYCVDFVRDSVSEDNAFKMLMATRTVEVLRHVALTFIHRRASDLLHLDSVKVLNQDMLLAAIPPEGLGPEREILVWKCVIHWACFHCGLSSESVPLLMFPKSPGRILVSVASSSHQDDGLKSLGFFPRDDDLVIRMSSGDHERLRQTISPLLSAVRFDVLSADCFCRYIEWTLLVPQEVVLKVYRHHAVPPAIPDTRFMA